MVTVFVDPLMDRGWVIRGRRTKSSHMFTDTLELDELHRVAKALGCKVTWFHDADSAPHYDLTPARRAAAVAAGVVEVDTHAAVEMWRARRAFIAGLAEAQR